MTGKRSDERPLADVPWLGAEDSRRVLAALTARGRPARFVGGCVRDALLVRAARPRELDLATSEPPDDVLRLLERAGIRAIATGLSHGTVTAVIEGRHFEITTLRRDVETDGRRAKVAFTDDFLEDAARRDFTINAMSCDAEGRLYDYFGGKADLARGRVRFVGEPAARIAEDHLRILRFFRFFAYYGRSPADAKALAACAAAASGIERLSGERIQSEMLRLLDALDPLPALRLMAKTGVLPRVMAEVVALDRLARLVKRAPDADAVLRLAALLRPPPAGPGAAGSVAERWRLSARDAKRLGALIETALPPLKISDEERRRALHRLGAERYADLARLAAAETPRSPRAALADALAAAHAWRPRRLPITGDEVTARGVPLGPRVGEILAKLEAWWIERDFLPDREACLAHLDELLARADS